MARRLEAVLVLAVVTVANSASLGHPHGTAEDDATTSAIDLYNREQNTSSFFRRLDSGPKGRPIVKNCSASTTGETTGASVVRCDTVINKPIFVRSRIQDDWKIDRDDKEKENGEVDTKPPGIFKDLLYKLQRNVSGDSQIQCLSCVLCKLTNSCR